MKLFTNKADIVAAIADIKVTGKKLDDMIQVAACSVLQHNELHGDVSLINDLVAAMPAGSRVNALREFIEKFGKVFYDDKTKAFKHAKKGVTMLEDAMATMWTTFKPEQPYKPMNLAAEVAALLKRAQDRYSDMKETDKVTLLGLKALEDAKMAIVREEAAALVAKAKPAEAVEAVDALEGTTTE